MEDDIDIYSDFEKKIDSGYDIKRQYGAKTREIADTIRKVAEILKKEIEDSPLEWEDKEKYINEINEILWKVPIVEGNDIAEILSLAEQLKHMRQRFPSVVKEESKRRKDKEMKKMQDEGPMKWKLEERKEEIYGGI
jgi:hypothetical protein